jgi:PD-(D/E)XK endonuclease
MPKRKAASRGRKLRLAKALPAHPSSNPRTPYHRELTTKRRGEISELAFALAAARHGFGISKPFGDSERYDIILDWHEDELHENDSHTNNFHPSHSRNHTARKNHRAQNSRPFTRPRLIRVQVKSSTQLLNGLYHLNAHRRINGRAVPYKLSEIDFIAAYVIPEDSWFIFPLPHILGLTSLLLSPKTRRRPSLYDNYREAWHHLSAPDGLIFA